MRYPTLVLKRLCLTPIHVCLEREGVNIYGEPLDAIELDLYCNFQDKAKTVLTSEKKLIEVTGTALFYGDIAPELSTISSGSVIIFGEKRRIVQGQKNRNPDGSVNYSTLEVK